MLSYEALADVAIDLVAARGLGKPALCPAAGERTATRIAADASFDAWLLAWAPGARVGPHDHGESQGALFVVRGELTEVRWSADDCVVQNLRPRDLVLLPMGLVHDVVATGTTVATSVHVYSPPLRHMGFYAPLAPARERVELVG